MDNPEKIKELSFEAAMTALEAIVERLSGSQPELDEMLRLTQRECNISIIAGVSCRTRKPKSALSVRISSLGGRNRWSPKFG